jgi:tetratricopeptide (TPR) repeat protein
MTKLLKRFLFAICIFVPISQTFASEMVEKETAPNTAGFGDISFPTSGSATAQPLFLEGVKALHSFQWVEAGIAFRAAQAADPTFAMAYWGEAMSYNHPLWAQQDTATAKAVLERFAATPKGQLAKLTLEHEKDWFRAIHALYYTKGDKLVRDTAYANFMAGMSERWSDDHEAQIFYALSLLGKVRPGDKGYRRQAKAASIALKIFAENERHPGAAHFIIHAFDDPDHAILAYPAAITFAGIAPAAAHALHMPSHIFVQLGMWDRAVKSNIDAYAAAMRVVKELNSEEGGEDFHTLSWLAYAYLMLGDDKNANIQLDRSQEALDRNEGSRRVMAGVLNMRARHILESNMTPKLKLEKESTVAGMHQNWVATIGMTAARNKDYKTAKAAQKRLGKLKDRAKGNEYNVKKLTILENQVAALTYQAKGNSKAAISSAETAARIELDIGAPSGPPDPLKPALELLAEILLDANKNEEALTAFEKSLAWIPNRTPSTLGLARAAHMTGRHDLAKEKYREIAQMPGGSPNSVAVMEAVAYLK